MKKLQKCFRLSNGIDVPCLGYGTWRIDGADAMNVVAKALVCGYRHIDTAAIYENEAAVGQAIRQRGLPREKLFITSKLWNDNTTFDQSLRAFDDSMARLKLDYLDLYLIHWPAIKSLDADWERTNREKWRALERLYQSGRVRAIGVSNYLPHHLTPLLDRANVLPMVNQIEIHPGHPQTATREFCQAHNILVQAWSPLASGAVLQVPELTEIAKKLSKTTAQVCLRWCWQNSVLPVAKTTSPARMAENMDIFSFSISDADMAIINNLPPCGGPCIDPDTRDF